MDLSVLSYFLPDLILEHFELSRVEVLCDVKTKKEIFEIHLDEKNRINSNFSSSEYESKGFLPSSRVQDFPIRGKAVYLILRKRRWRHKNTRKEISNDYHFVAKGSKLTEDISAFLKGTGRDPRRYDK
jgi:hypothetical protein